jgi:hypothetical protein
MIYLTSKHAPSFLALYNIQNHRQAPMLFEAYTFNFEGSGNPLGGVIGRKNALNFVKMPIGTMQPLPKP